MKKVVVASLLACAVIVSGLPSALAQTPVSLGSQAAASNKVQMSGPEYTAYTDAMKQTDPKAKAAAIEAYLNAYPQSAVKLDTLVTLMVTYSTFDPAKTLDAADRVLQLDPNNLRALIFEAYLRKNAADSLTDAAAKQAALDQAASYAQKGLAATKPDTMTDADFKKLQDTAFPIFYSVIGNDDMAKKDTAGAIDAFKKELSSVPVAQTEAPGLELQDTYELALAYYQSTPPDYVNCTFYATRAVNFAPPAFKTQMSPVAKYCYKKYHGGDDGYDAVVAAAQANLNPPPGFSVKPAPTPADIVNNVIATTPDLSTLAVGDREFILQNGTPDQAAKVWDTMKGKSVEIPGAVVIASTPTQVQVAVSDDSVQSKTADFTFNLAPRVDVPELKKNATAAQKKLHEKYVAEAKKFDDEVAAATAVGNKVTLDGTYDSYTAKPLMITMTNGAVVLPKADKPAPVHHTTRSRARR